MGNFYFVLPKPGCASGAKSIFERGLEAFRCLKAIVPKVQVSSEEWIYAASFARLNGSGGVLVRDAETGAFLSTIGTWFEDSGLGPGDEGRLLDRYLGTKPSQLAASLQGFFAVVFADRLSREAVVITDIIGSCHCYFRDLPEATAVCSSPLILAALKEVSLDHVACQEFLQTGIMYEDRTFFREVRKLAPASLHRFSTNGHITERYWDARALGPRQLEDNASIRNLWQDLVASGERIARCFDRPVCDLTGGYDSRALVAAFSSTDMKLSTTVSGDRNSPDVAVARRLAAKIGLPLHHIVSDSAPTFADLREAFSLTDGEYDIVDYVRILKTHKILSAQFDISLNGSFGEVARGYWWELLIPRTGKQVKLDSQKLARKRYAYQDTESLYRPELRIALAPHFAEVIERTNAGLYDFPNTFQMDHAYLYMRMQCWQGRIARSTNQLWPCLSPFMLRQVLSTMLSARPSLRKRSLMIRRMLEEFHPIFADEPLEYGYPAASFKLSNMHHFWPLLLYYGAKVNERIMRKVTNSNPSARAAAEKSTSPINPEIRDLLNPSKMQLSSVLDESALGTFLAQTEHSGSDHKWRVLLTLEYTLLRLKEFLAKPF